MLKVDSQNHKVIIESYSGNAFLLVLFYVSCLPKEIIPEVKCTGCSETELGLVCFHSLYSSDVNCTKPVITMPWMSGPNVHLSYQSPSI